MINKPQVHCFDEKAAKEALKSCPEIVRDYVKLLEDSSDGWREIANKAINKLKKGNIR